MTTNPKRFAPNLGKKGRWLRGLGAVALLAGGLAMLPVNVFVSLGFFAGGAFMLFEALRGWCALRACGIKTKF
jgi:hypothetical protein